MIPSSLRCKVTVIKAKRGTTCFFLSLITYKFIWTNQNLFERIKTNKKNLWNPPILSKRYDPINVNCRP